MYRNKTVCVVVPAFNEELLIAQTIETVPEFVDKIIVVDDSSDDATPDIVTKIERENHRVISIRHTENGGVGAAVRTGYIWSRENNMDITVVMNGDNQMDPADLPALLDPIVENTPIIPRETVW